MEETRICPSCQEPMEKGCVAAESITGGAKWHKSRSLLAVGGEKIGDYRWDGMVWFDGFRCAKCRLLVLSF
ncbi:MAG: PF20097 family protein [Thermoplasmata archaeon]